MLVFGRSKGVRRMTEVWRPVLGFEGYYEASSIGRLRRVKTQGGRASGRISSPGDRRGYANYTLSVDNAQRTLSAHRMVWEAFYGPIPLGLQINHKNGEKRDNRLVNLEVCSPSENTSHAVRVLKRTWNVPPRLAGSMNGRAKLSEADIPEIRRLRAAGLSQQKIADQFGVNQTLISGILSGKLWREGA